MPNNKPNLGIVKEFIVKARIELYTGGAQDLESPEIITYHTLVISAVNKSQAEKEAKEKLKLKIPERTDGSVVVERCTRGV